MAGSDTKLEPTDEAVELTDDEIARARRAMQERLEHKGDETMTARHMHMEENRKEVDHTRSVVRWLFSARAWVALAGSALFGLLALRMGLMMGDANARADFVDFIYNISGPLVHPFQDMMRNRAVDGGGIFEPATAIAMGVYLIAALLTIAVLWALAASWPVRREGVVRRTVVHQG